jgi:hypothetical protein
MKTMSRFKLAAAMLLTAAAQAALAHPYGHHETGTVLLRAHTHASEPGSWALALVFLGAGVALHLVSHRLRAHRWPARLAAWCLAAGGAALLMA